MAWAFQDEASATAYSAADDLAVGAIDVATGDLIVVIAGSWDNREPSSVSDDIGNTISPIATQTQGGTEERIFYCVSTGTDSTNNITVTYGGSGSTRKTAIASAHRPDSGDTVTMEGSANQSNSWSSSDHQTGEVDSSGDTSNDILYICGLAQGGSASWSNHEIPSGTTTGVVALTSAQNHVQGWYRYVTSGASGVEGEISPSASTDTATTIVWFSSAAAGTEVDCTTDALTLTEYSATVNAEISVAATTDALTLTEYSATVNAGISVSAGVDALTLTTYSATVNAAVNVAANVDALTLTENSATVNAAISVSATTDALTLTEYGATVNAGVNVSAEVAALTLTENFATVNAALNIAAATDALSLTTYGATVDVGGDVTVDATTAALTLTEYGATVNAAVNVGAGVDALTLTEYGALVSAGINVDAALAALTLTEYGALVNAEISIAAAVDPLTLTEYAATVSVPDEWTSILIVGTNAITGQPVQITGKYKEI